MICHEICHERKLLADRRRGPLAATSRLRGAGRPPARARPPKPRCARHAAVRGAPSKEVLPAEGGPSDKMLDFDSTSDAAPSPGPVASSNVMPGLADPPLEAPDESARVREKSAHLALDALGLDQEHVVTSARQLDDHAVRDLGAK